MTTPLLDQLERSLAYGDAVMNAVPDDARHAPTPCADFDVEALAGHVISGLEWLGELPVGGSPDPMSVPAPDLAGRSLVGSYRVAVDRVGETWSPTALDATFAMRFGEISGADIVGYTVFEVLVHAWDIAVATGQRARPPDDVAEAALGLAQGLSEELLRQPGMMGPAVPVADDAPPMDRLVAFCGRDPSAV